jgi:hypothetical protein
VLVGSVAVLVGAVVGHGGAVVVVVLAVVLVEVAGAVLVVVVLGGNGGGSGGSGVGAFDGAGTIGALSTGMTASAFCSVLVVLAPRGEAGRGRVCPAWVGAVAVVDVAAPAPGVAAELDVDSYDVDTPPWFRRCACRPACGRPPADVRPSADAIPTTSASVAAQPTNP